MEVRREQIRRMQELIAILNEAARAYYTENTQIMTDALYDRYYDELSALEESTGIILSGSITQRVGYEILPTLPKERHTEPRLSLNKTKEVSELSEFLGDKEGILMWKLDGITIVLTYEDGKLVKGLTRGDGVEGELVTENVKRFQNVPLHIPYKGQLVIRGEAVIKYSDFFEMNEEITEEAEKYKNPRNLCSGSVRQLNTEITAKRRVNFIVYELPEGGERVLTREEGLSFLAEQGFEVVEHPLVTAETVAEEVKAFSEKIKTYDYPSDGLVLQINDIAFGKSLGKTAKFPKHSIAFKWKDETADTILREIEWSASRTGLINPVAVFDPVELEGTTVSRASLHNVSIMKGLRLGIGDKIRVYKANMIIPQILENLTCSNHILLPASCPVCGEKTALREEGEVQTLYCKNTSCPAKKIKLLTHFVSRNAMNIAGLSEMTLEKFVTEHMLFDLADLFLLERYKERIVHMEGFGEKSFENLISSIEKARETTAVRFLYSLGIPNIGLAGAKLICKHFGQDVDRIREAKKEELTALNGIGEVMAEAYVAFFKDEENRRMVERLLKELRFKEGVKEKEEGEQTPLSGLTFVITGEVSSFKNRKELADFIEERGGKVTGSVTGKTSYLINNDILSSSGKNKKAKELGVAVINEEDFMKLVGG